MKSRRKFRLGIINVIYQNELFATKLDINKIFEEQDDIDSEQFKQLEKIAKNYNYYQKVISKFLQKDWSYHRVSPLIRAILINAVNELFYLKPRIVINEAIEITKYYFGDENRLYKVVNALLENVYKYFIFNEVILKN